MFKRIQFVLFWFRVSFIENESILNTFCLYVVNFSFLCNVCNDGVLQNEVRVERLHWSSGFQADRTWNDSEQV